MTGAVAMSSLLAIPSKQAAMAHAYQKAFLVESKERTTP